ncbi:hypothetical protein FHR90_003261 [Endobacter medicaginis]|uniref:Uncharacterized protein n=1 Tax=Endobacter medicaginis TaxID=1181271 RepID=A0A839V050_9PROT|nr:hypothetical protein [Endobacter medicaginis]MBB3175406.1 hypothetical protein [Endobacter medicaginis]MCX5476889.1 hypothetical protein [Endobacter medicaginis]
MTVLESWPASVIQGTKGEKSDVGLPSETRSPWFNVMLPSAGATVLSNDIAYDSAGQRYIVSSVSIEGAVYRLTMMEAE